MGTGSLSFAPPSLAHNPRHVREVDRHIFYHLIYETLASGSIEAHKAWWDKQREAFSLSRRRRSLTSSEPIPEQHLKNIAYVGECLLPLSSSLSVKTARKRRLTRCLHVAAFRCATVIFKLRVETQTRNSKKNARKNAAKKKAKQRQRREADAEIDALANAEGTVALVGPLPSSTYQRVWLWEFIRRDNMLPAFLLKSGGAVNGLLKVRGSDSLVALSRVLMPLPSLQFQRTTFFDDSRMNDDTCEALYTSLQPMGRGTPIGDGIAERLRHLEGLTEEEARVTPRLEASERGERIFLPAIAILGR